MGEGCMGLGCVGAWGWGITASQTQRVCASAAQPGCRRRLPARRHQAQPWRLAARRHQAQPWRLAARRHQAQPWRLGGRGEGHRRLPQLPRPTWRQANYPRPPT